MEDLVRDISITVLAIILCARWYFIAKNPASRKYILLIGVCFVITGVAYINAKAFDIGPLMGISILAFLGMFYFLIKAIRSEHKAIKNL